MREVIAAAEILDKEYGVTADIWSVTSFNELRREALDAGRWNLLHPAEPARLSYVGTCLKDRPGPVVAATDYMKVFADQIREFVPARYKVLGTDGLGVRIHGPGCGGFLKLIAITSLWPRLQRWPKKAALRPGWWNRR